jgi:hypothetical protein
MLQAVFVLILLGTSLAAGAGDEVPLRSYACDDGQGVRLKDSSPSPSHGLLNAQPSGEERGARAICTKTGEWVPILSSDGIQRKGFVPGSEMILVESERPIVLDRGKDFEIDDAGGRFRALPGGRVDLNVPLGIDFKYANPGPSWTTGRVGGGLRLDGVDDFVNLGRLPPSFDGKAATLELWVKTEAAGSPEAVFLTSEADPSAAAAFGLRLNGGKPQFFHHGLRGGAGGKAPPTAAPDLLSRGGWHHLAGTWDGKEACLWVDGKLAAKQAGLSGALAAPGGFILGGCRDPGFLDGVVDEIRIWGVARNPADLSGAARTGDHGGAPKP